MKGLILSGGKGTRLRPLTFSTAKQLIPVANKPVLFYGLEAMRDAGMTDVGIVVGDTAKEIEAAVGDGSRWGLTVTYIHQNQPLGLAHAVAVSREFLGDSEFVMYLGDNLIRSGIGGLVEEFKRERPNAIILLTQVPNPGEFGVAELDGDRVLRLEEKPKQPKSNFALVGVYLFDLSVHHAIAGLRPSFRGELEITDAIQGLIDRGMDVRSHKVSGWWKDTGTVEAVLDANRVILHDLVPSVSANATLDGCRIDATVSVGSSTLKNVIAAGPAIIGDDCKLTDVTIGANTAIGDGCSLENCEIANSILMKNSTLLGPLPTIRDSLIGSGVCVRGKSTDARLVLGDSSQIDI
jgi:glucose-1-phosphate thymidylyltransferase